MAVTSSERPTRPLTLREAADRCGVAPVTMRAWIRQGVIPAYRVGPGGHYRVDARDLAEVIHRT